MKILNAILTLAIGLVAGIGLAIAVPVLANQAKHSYKYSQDHYTAGKWETTVVDDNQRGVTCYHSVYYGGAHRPTSSCVKVK